MNKLKNINISNILGMLLILFIILKLTNVIGWSWFWVLSPLTIPLSFLCGFVLFCLMIIYIGDYLWKKV